MQGISLSIDQYNALLTSAPLLESVLTEREEKTVRPKYDGEVAQPAEADEEGGDDEGQDNEEEDEEE